MAIRAAGGGLRYGVLLLAALVPIVRLLVYPPGPAFPRDPANQLQTRSDILLTAPHFLGPESLAFDRHGRGPYTGAADGRVLVWDGPERGWTEFAFTSPRRSDACIPKKPLVMDLNLEALCGRPLGLRFHDNGDLYIADAYYGLRTVGPEGGLAEALVEEAEGIPLKFTNDVDFGEDGQIYFTDSSTNYQKRHFLLMFLLGDNSGRLLSYNPSTQQTKVHLRGLKFPNGIAMSQDRSFLLICETLERRVLRYWVQGPKAGKLEVFARLPGYPDNIRQSKRGGFWVAIHAQPNWVLRLPVVVRRVLLRLPIPFTQWYMDLARKHASGMVVRLGMDGEVVEVLEDAEGKKVKLLSGVEEQQGKLWLGSVVLPQVAVYPLKMEEEQLV